MLYLIGNNEYSRELLMLCEALSLPVNAHFTFPFWSGLENIETLSEDGLPVIKNFYEVTSHSRQGFLLGILDNQDRKKALEILLDHVMENVFEREVDIHFPSLIHPHANVSKRVKIGEGTVVMAVSASLN